MPLPSGTKLGPYEIQSPLGAGGMGEVYRARDTRLDRTVAVKILPTHLSADPEFKQRFEREARAVSSLNHPNICQLFDVGRQDGIDFLVMEFLDGETLAERVRRGPLPLAELAKVGMTVAQALAAAHRAGMVHRDLKPANVMLTKAGAKLMDFGLAKPVAPGAAGSASAPLLSAAKTMSGPTPVSPLTMAGSIVGTIQYMSPEQIEGKETDSRADIFALGAVLYEMATGKRAFEGKSQISVASAILEKDPEPVRSGKPEMPPALDALIAGCLAKDREERFQSAHDVWLELRAVAQAGPTTVTAAQEEPKGAMGLRVLVGIAALLLIGAAAFFFLTRRASVMEFAVRAYIPPPAGAAFRPSGFDAGPVVVSPDGKTLAFTAIDEKGNTNLWTRALDAQHAVMLPGTEDASNPFWSPDARYLGFVADRKLKKIAVSGGEAQTLVDDAFYGYDWRADGTILLVKGSLGDIYRVDAAGGAPTLVLGKSKDEWGMESPSFLPDGKHFLYRGRRRNGPGQIKVGVLGKPEQDGVVVTEGSSPRYASGHLLFVRGGKLLAQPFDPDSFKLSGDPQTLGEASDFSVSANGVLAFHESSSESEMKVFDRSGNVVSTPGPLGLYAAPRFSPDGKSIAVTVEDPKSGGSDIWIYPTAGGQPQRFTFGPNVWWAVWSPDGRELAYTQRENGRLLIRRRPLDGSKPEENLYDASDYVSASTLDFSPDGKYLSLDLECKDLIFSNWILPLSGDRKPFRPEATAGITVNQYDGLFSPDGRWLSYFSYESGRPEVYVVPFLTNGPKYQASTTGGWLSRFTAKEYFYVTAGNRLMAGRMVTQPSFRLDDVHPLFQLDLPNFTGPHMDVTRDGQRFVVLTVDRTKNSSITLMTNWTAGLKN